MWDRKTLKQYAKAAFKANYWKCVLVAFLAGLTTTTINLTTTKDLADVQKYEQNISSVIRNLTPGAVVAIVSVSGIIVAGAIALSLLVFNPLKVSCNNFFVKNSNEKDAPLEYLSSGFKGNYWNTVLVMFIKDLFIFLWSLLFVIPGIIKSYSYRMVPYILTKHPDMRYKDAINLSRKMMDGNKWRAFVLDISFAGWIMLSILTLGILIPFYVSPYIEATNAELYKALRDGGNPTGEPMTTEPEDKIITFEA